jgi:hypothetical protein
MAIMVVDMTGADTAIIMVTGTIKENFGMFVHPFFFAAILVNCLLPAF